MKSPVYGRLYVGLIKLGSCIDLEQSRSLNWSHWEIV
jgi:hypothetical protein